MEHQNWKPTVSISKHKSHTTNLSKQALLNKNIDTVKKTTQKGPTTGSQMHKIIESETLEVPQITMELKQAIVKARIDKGLKQKDFAQLLGVKEGIVRGYESGKTVPENSIISKMEQVLKCKLPRPKKIKL
jgi:ribosome-binding protein aMBF1 (putative translation factor)